MKVVIVDNSAEMRRLIRTILPKETQVIECADGPSAIRACREHAPEWVLLDIAMTPLDGISTAERLRAMAPDARIIFVTAYNELRWRGVAERLGVCGYVVKDALEQINEIIQHYSQGRSQRRGSKQGS